MSDTVENTGNVDTVTEVSQSDGQTENTSANPNDTNTSVEESGQVADANNDKAVDEGTQEGSDQNQESGYEFEKLKLPDGFTATDEQKAEFAKDVESLGITTQDGAQRFVDWIIEKAGGSQALLAEQQENDIGNLEKSWVEDGKKDPVLGKEYEKNVSDAMETAGKLFSPHTMEFLKDTRFDKNPDFLKDMLRIAKERADAELITGRNANRITRINRDSQGNPMLSFK